MRAFVPLLLILAGCQPAVEMTEGFYMVTKSTLSAESTCDALLPVAEEVLLCRGPGEPERLELSRANGAGGTCAVDPTGEFDCGASRIEWESFPESGPIQVAEETISSEGQLFVPSRFVLRVERTIEGIGACGASEEVELALRLEIVGGC